MTIRKVSPDARVLPRGTTWNLLADAVNGGGFTPPPNETPNQSATVYIKNTTGDVVPRFGVLGIDGPLIDPGDNEKEYKRRVVLKGVEPASADHESLFVVTAEPIRAGLVGRAYVTGVCLANVDIQTSGDTHATVTDTDNSKLTSGSGPAEIIWPLDQTGEVVSIVRLGSPSASEGTFAVNLTSSLGGLPFGVGGDNRQAYEGDMIVAPSLQFRETPTGDQVGPVFMTNSDNLLASDAISELVVDVQRVTANDGSTQYLGTYFRSLPAGGTPGESLHIGTDDQPYWSYYFATDT